MKKVFASLILVLLLLPFHSKAQLKGFVFIDRNENGKPDEDENGFEGAVLSDGLNVVRSGSEGYFHLDGWEKQRFVTLYREAGYACRDYYISVTTEKEEYVFALKPQKIEKDFQFVQISDTETYEFRDWVDHLKKYIKVHSPAFLVHTGDICYRSGMQWHAENITRETMGVPVYYCLGNHDLVAGDYGEQYFEHLFGPAWYAFEEGNTLFVVTPMMRGDYEPGFTREEIGRWLRNLLKIYDRSKPKFFFNHDLLTSDENFEFEIRENETLVLNDYHVKAWAFGHHHRTMMKQHGPQGIISYGTSTVKGGIDHSPSAYRVIDVGEDGNVSSHMRWLYLSRNIQIVSPLDGLARKNPDGEVRISVNIYDSGTEVDSVRFGIWGAEGYNWESSLDGFRWKAMHQNSDWNWSAWFQAQETGMHEVVVEAYLSSGETLAAKEKFSVDDFVEESFSGQWSNLGGNREHHPVVHEKHQLPYQMNWVSNIGSNIFMSSPVLSKNRLFTSGFDDGNGEDCFIVALNASTGEEAWRYETVNGVKNQMVIAGDILIACDMQGITYALDVNSGRLHWKKEPPVHEVMGFVKGLVTDGKVVYTGSGKNLCARDVSDGRILWQNDAWSGGDGTTTTMTIADDVLVASKQWGAIYAHDSHNGRLLWSKSDEGLRFRDGVLGYSEGFLWVAGRHTNDPDSDVLYRLELATGKTLERVKTGMQHSGTSAPIVLEDKVIVASSHPGIAAFNRTEGEKMWDFEVEPALVYTPSYFYDHQRSIESTPVWVDGKIIFGAMDGRLYVLDSENGRLLWEANLGAPVITSAAVTENGFFVCDFAGNVYCFTKN